MPCNITGGFIDRARNFAHGYFWTPFVSAGLGVAQDRVTLDNQVFEDLSPVGRYRAGLEKKVSNNVTFGVSAGQSFKLN